MPIPIKYFDDWRGRKRGLRSADCGMTVRSRVVSPARLLRNSHFAFSAAGQAAAFGNKAISNTSSITDTEMNSSRSLAS
jgi:hypothetical protein